MPPFTADIRTTDDVVLVALGGELDMRGSTLLDPQLHEIAEAPGPATVVLDLRGLRFMDSSGLRSVMIADAALRAAGRRLVLVRGGPEVQRVFEVTRMDSRLAFVDDPVEVG